MRIEAEEEIGRAYDARLLRWVWCYVQPYRRLFWLSVALMPLNSIFALLQPTSEVPSLSSGASGRFKATVDPLAETITYELSYDGLEGDVLQSHIHVGQHSVNGGIEMKDVGGSGSVQTVNGGVNVAFAEIPRTECSFKSVNGGLTVKFPPSLSADIRMKTVNGQAFTDFESTTLPNAEGLAERKGNMFVYRSNRAVGFRVGGGGVEHKFETVNGSIRILK